jgi:hypothetical protein
MSSDKSLAHKSVDHKSIDHTNQDDKKRIYSEVRKCNRQLDLWIFSNTPPFPYCYYNRLTDYNYALNQYNVCLNNIQGFGKNSVAEN